MPWAWLPRVDCRRLWRSGGRLQRVVTSIREVNGVDGRVLSSEVFAETPDGLAEAFENPVVKEFIEDELRYRNVVGSKNAAQ